MNVEEARQKILSKIKFNGLDEKWTPSKILFVIFGLFVILSTAYTTFEILRELGAPDIVKMIAATAAFTRSTLSAPLR